MLRLGEQEPSNAPDVKNSEDGAGAPQFGSELQEPDYSVEVKLSDLQADPNNPLYSVKSFDDLGLQVTPMMETNGYL